MYVVLAQKKTPALAALALSSKRKSDRLQIGGSGLAAARVGLHVERKLLAFVEIAHAGALDCRDVNKHIGAAAVLHDKAEALLGVEELNGTSGHHGLLMKTRKAFMPHANRSHGPHIRILRVPGKRPLRPK